MGSYIKNNVNTVFEKEANVFMYISHMKIIKKIKS